jgi:acyl carrier protein
MLKEERLTMCLLPVMGPLTEPLTPATDLFDDLGMDSLDRVEFVMAVEDEFGFDIDDDVADTLRTWGQFLKLVEKFGRPPRWLKEESKSTVAGG